MFSSIDWHTYSFLIYAAVSGSCLCCLSGPLGALMVWQRLSYFSDTLAHTSLLGAACALSCGVNIYAGMAISTIAVAYLLRAPSMLTADTKLALLSHSLFAIALLLMSLLAQKQQINIIHYLYGDILTVSSQQLINISITVLLLLIVLRRYWGSLIMLTLHRELAQAEGLAVQRLQTLYLLLLAISFTVLMPIFGALLLGALFILPQASARLFARTPEAMAWQGSAYGILAVNGGLALSYWLDWPSSPTIIVVASGIFAMLSLYHAWRQRRLRKTKNCIC
jgi:zinc transport system permease protein